MYVNDGVGKAVRLKNKTPAWWDKKNQRSSCRHADGVRLYVDKIGYEKWIRGVYTEMRDCVFGEKLPADIKHEGSSHEHINGRKWVRDELLNNGDYWRGVSGGMTAANKSTREEKIYTEDSATRAAAGPGSDTKAEATIAAETSEKLPTVTCGKKIGMADLEQCTWST